MVGSGRLGNSRSGPLMNLLIDRENPRIIPASEWGPFLGRTGWRLARQIHYVNPVLWGPWPTWANVLYYATCPISGPLIVVLRLLDLTAQCSVFMIRAAWEYRAGTENAKLIAQVPRSI